MARKLFWRLRLEAQKSLLRKSALRKREGTIKREEARLATFWLACGNDIRATGDNGGRRERGAGFQTSVSLVLNFAEGARLSPQTRQRVINAARKLGYQPVRREKIASGTSTIAFFCDEISTDPWAAVALNGVSEKAWEYGLSVTATVTHGDPEIEAAAFAQLAARPHAGLIYATINTRLVRANPAFFNQPTILLNCHCAKSLFSSVVPDEAEGGYAATNVLIRAGHKRIGYIGGEVGMEASRLRLHGYKRALADSGPALRRGSPAPRRLAAAFRLPGSARPFGVTRAPNRHLLRQRHDGRRLLRCTS